jgi:hypothetical protein
MPDRNQMMEALDAAFAEHIKTLFAIFAGSPDVAQAQPHFAKGLKQACDAHEKAVAAIAALTPSRAVG